MIKIENVTVMNFEGALRGMRNPLNSWALCDSSFKDGNAVIGQKDMKLALNLIKAGSDERKFIRQIMVCFDLTLPLYTWKEFDTYKIGTVANSTSTMHKLGSRHLTADDFSLDDEDGNNIFNDERKYLLSYLNNLIDKWNEAKKNDPLYAKKIWRIMIQDLPNSFNQMRTITLNYEVLRNMYFARKNHKQKEWRDFCKWTETLPYSEFITTS